MGYDLVGLSWTPDSFRRYLASLPRPLWAKGICLHHTASPDLSMRPNGLTPQHMRNLRYYYEIERKWASGPHLFVDDHGIHGMSALMQKGIHAGSLNETTIGIEVLGNYDAEDHATGRGLACWSMAASASAELLRWLGLAPNEMTVKFHRDDPGTSKTCPGKRIQKPWVMGLIRERSLFADPAIQRREQLLASAGMLREVADRLEGMA